MATIKGKQRNSQLSAVFLMLALMASVGYWFKPEISSAANELRAAAESTYQQYMQGDTDTAPQKIFLEPGADNDRATGVVGNG